MGKGLRFARPQGPAGPVPFAGSVGQSLQSKPAAPKGLVSLGQRLIAVYCVALARGLPLHLRAQMGGIDGCLLPRVEVADEGQQYGFVTDPCGRRAITHSLSQAAIDQHDKAPVLEIEGGRAKHGSPDEPLDLS